MADVIIDEALFRVGIFDGRIIISYKVLLNRVVIIDEYGRKGVNLDELNSQR